MIIVVFSKTAISYICCCLLRAFSAVRQFSFLVPVSQHFPEKRPSGFQNVITKLLEEVIKRLSCEAKSFSSVVRVLSLLALSTFLSAKMEKPNKGLMS